MTVEVNGIAHIQMTVNDIKKSLPFWESLCHFLEMKTLVKNSKYALALLYPIHGHLALFDQ